MSIADTAGVADAGAPATVDHAPGLETALLRVPEERSYEIAGIRGTLPSYLRGTHYSNGPARLRRGDLTYRHWLDGDGMVCAMTFGDGGVRFANRFVASTKLTDEEAAGAPLYRTFGTAFPGDRLLKGIMLASPVNVSVYPFAGKLLAFGEQGLPWELDPNTLATLGEHTFARRLNAISPFSAHPNFDPASGELLNFGVSFASREPLLTLYRFAADGELVYRRRHTLPYPCTIHDFGLSARHAIFHLSPYLMDMAAFRDDDLPVIEALRWQPEQPAQLLILERDGGEEVARVPLPPVAGPSRHGEQSEGAGHCLHHINAFEDPADKGRLIVDLIELTEPAYDDYQPLPELFAEVAPATPVRYVVDLAAEEGRGALVERRPIELGLGADFPAYDPRLTGRPYRHCWLAALSHTGKPGRKFLDRLICCDWQRGGVASAYQLPPGRYLAAEPVFIADPEAPADSGAGTVLCPSYDAGREATSYLLFEPLALERGPIVEIALESPIHLAFHSHFEPAG